MNIFQRIEFQYHIQVDIFQVVAFDSLKWHFLSSDNGQLSLQILLPLDTNFIFWQTSKYDIVRKTICVPSKWKEINVKE